jgi:Flp pilus assembly protein TadG
MTASHHRPRRRADAGNAPLELVILAPVIIMLIALVIAVGRISVATGAISAAARDAARQASISLSPAAAQAAALASADAALANDGLDCAPTVTPDLAGFAAPPGQPSTVTVTVSCTVPLADLTVPGMPGSKTLTAQFTSPIDPYRQRR